MSQKKVKQIKRIIKYSKDDPVHKRVFKRLYKEYKNKDEMLITEKEGFKRRLTGRGNIKINTNIYGLFPIKIGKINAIRHVLHLQHINQPASSIFLFLCSKVQNH